MSITQIENVPEPRQVTDAQQIIDWRLNYPDSVPKNYPARWMDTDWRNDPSRGIDNGYSRLYPRESMSGAVIAHTAFDGECHMFRHNGEYIRPISENEWNPVGWNQEPRWLPNGKIVYRHANAIWLYDSRGNHKIIDVTNAIYSGGEGSVSDGGRYYPIMTGVYNQATGRYEDIRVGIADLQSKHCRLIPRSFKPNAIDVSPDGKWFLILDHSPDEMKIMPISDSILEHSKRQTVNPGFSVGHSGWAVDDQGRTVIVLQNNDNDHMSAYLPESGGRWKVAHMKDDLKMWGSDGDDRGPVMGWHCGRGNAFTKGWALISTYAKENFNEFANQIYMLKLDGSAGIYKVCPTGNLYRGYHSEAPAALSKDGRRIYWGSNNNAQRNVELHSVELPAGWQSDEPVKPPDIDPMGPWEKVGNVSGYDVYRETEYVGKPDYILKYGGG